MDRTKVARILTKSMPYLQQSPESENSENLGDAIIKSMANRDSVTLNELLSLVPTNSATALTGAIHELTEHGLITDQEPADGRLRLTPRGKDLLVVMQLR
jgi:hypothetical protein